jgi:hypothetical protein
VLDDAFVQNFFTWTVSRAPSASELTYWNDQLRVAYAQGQASVKLAAVEFAKTLFESAEYAARNRNDQSQKLRQRQRRKILTQTPTAIAV